MLKTHWKLISRLERAGDNALIFLAFFLTYYLRDNIFWLGEYFNSSLVRTLNDLGPIEEYYIVLGFAIPAYNAVLTMLGGYKSMRFSSEWRLVRVAALSSLIVFFFLGSLLFLLKIDLSRSFVGSFCFLCGVGHMLQRYLVLQLLRYYRSQGRNFRNLLIVGTGEQARNIYFQIVRQPELGVKVIGFVTLESLSEIYDLPARVVADVYSFESALKKFAVDEVVFVDFVDQFATVKELAQIAAEEGVRVTLAADLFSLGLIRSDTSYLGTVPLVHFQSAPHDTTQLVVKRALDIVVASSAAIILLPVCLVIAFLIKIDSPGPVLFRQRRVGLNGRTFMLLKFRSMVVNAEEMLENLREKNEMRGPVFKLSNDPRITRVGRFLRRYSLDELPQFFNVLRGDMSLVGPRPPLPHEVSLYERKQRRRLSMRPGITCTWQVSGRNDIPDFQEWAELDLAYIDTWSLGKDVKLLLKTIPAVISGSGAR